MADSAFEHEEIYLSSDEVGLDDARPTDARPVIAVLEQEHPHVPGWQRLRIHEGERLRLERRHGRGEPWSVDLDLGFLDPRPGRELRMPWCSMGITVLALTGLLTLLWPDGVAQPLGWGWQRMAGAVAAAGVAALGISVGLRRFRRRIVFTTRHGGTPVLHLLEDHPDRERWQTFRKALGAAAERGLQRLPRDPGRYLAEELKEHRRLARIGHITPKSYEAAKARILARHHRPRS